MRADAQLLQERRGPAAGPARGCAPTSPSPSMPARACERERALVRNGAAPMGFSTMIPGLLARSALCRQRRIVFAWAVSLSTTHPRGLKRQQHGDSDICLILERGA